MFEWTKSEFIVLPIAFVVIVALAVILGLWLKNKDKKFRKVPLQLLAFFVLGMELYKQCTYFGNPNFNFYVLPLHFCSTFVFLFPLSQLFGEKCGKVFKPMAFCYALAVVVLMYANPHAIIGYSCADVFGSFHNIHTFFFHHSLLAYVALSVALGDYKPKFSHCKNVAIGVVVYACYAAPSAYALNSNYANILYSGWEVFESFRLWAGQVWYNVVLFVVGVSAMVLVCVLCNLIRMAFEKLKAKKAQQIDIKSQNMQKNN